MWQRNHRTLGYIVADQHTDDFDFFSPAFGAEPQTPEA